MMRRTMMRLLTTLVVSLGTTAAYSQTPQEIARKAFASTVLLVMEDRNGQPLSLGSGFLVATGEIVSNLHVVEGATKGYAKLVGQNAKYDIEGTLAVDAERDLVLLKITSTAGAMLRLAIATELRLARQSMRLEILKVLKVRSRRVSSAECETLEQTSFFRSPPLFLPEAAAGRF